MQKAPRQVDVSTHRIVRRFDIRGQVVQVATESAQASALLTDTFHPAGMFDVRELPRDDSSPDVTLVDLVASSAEIRDIIAGAKSRGAAGEYELTRGYRRPRYDSGDSTVFVLSDVNSDESAALLRADGVLTIVRGASTLGDRWLTRVVRDIATRYATDFGSLILHSSAFAFRGLAYLVIGDSGAGKSTTAIALARLLEGAGWMGNDRVHLDRAQRGGYRVTACPLPLAINKGSLDVMGIADFQHWNLHAGFPDADSDWSRHMGEDKLKMSSHEVERYLEVPVVPEARLGGIIFPRVVLGSPYSFGSAPREYAADVMGRNCFSVDDNLYGENWLAVSAGRTTVPPTVAEFLSQVADLPLLRCVVGEPGDVARLSADFRRSVAG